MQISKVQAVGALVVMAVGLLGYMTDAANYYQPRANADLVHSDIRAYVESEIAATKSWSELESINHQIQVLELQIQRIVDRAAIVNRGLTDEERQQIASLRDEIRFHNDRKNQILARQR